MAQGYGETQKAGASTQSAYEYGRNGEPLPDIHVFAALTALDEAYMAEVQGLRARQEAQEREIAGLAKRLAAPLEEEGGGQGGFWRRLTGTRKQTKGG